MVYGNGSGSSTGYTDNGNVFIYTYAQGNYRQQWYIEPATNYEQPKIGSSNAIDSGGHMDWGGTTKYLTEFKSAVNTWNYYKNGVIREDSGSTVKDITISDVEWGDNRILGETKVNVLFKTIKFNTSILDERDSRTRECCCLHELGHALGLSHREERASLMVRYNTGLIDLPNCDLISYNYAFNNI